MPRGGALLLLTGGAQCSACGRSGLLLPRLGRGLSVGAGTARVEGRELFVCESKAILDPFVSVIS